MKNQVVEIGFKFTTTDRSNFDKQFFFYPPVPSEGQHLKKMPKANVKIKTLPH
jgi:hypothetical protein